jgi:F-box and leucine-rich repeat protein 2/20
MIFPAPLPNQLFSYQQVSFPQASFWDELFNLLLKKTSDLILFFETAADDETWSEEHPDFMKKVIEWISQRTAEDRLEYSFSLRAANIIRKHYFILNSLIPQNLRIHFRNETVEINTLLLGTISEFFRSLIIKEYRGKKEGELFFQTIDYGQFIPFETFANKGIISDLYRCNQEELIQLLQQAIQWQVTAVIEACENALVKYVNRENVSDFLILAHKEQCWVLKNYCFTFINQFAAGYQFYASAVDRIGFTFESFNDKSIQAFEQFCLHITDLSFPRNLNEDVQFIQIMQRSSHIQRLDLSRSDSQGNSLIALPKNLKELDLSECLWLKPGMLKQFSIQCPELNKLNLSGNSQINYSIMGELMFFSHLNTLDLSRCYQVNNKDLEVLLKACKQLVNFSLNECRNIDDEGFFKIGKYVPQIICLELSHCNISNGSLIEIATQCRLLSVLNLSRCEQITEKGVLQLLKQLPLLKTIDITHCNISLTIIQQIRERHTSLTLVF